MVIFGIDFTHIIQAYGPVAIFAVLFAESAIIFFLPGDSFLFVAGVLAAQHSLAFWPSIILGLFGAILGNNFGYYLGKKFGHLLLTSQKKWMFKKEHVDKVQQYYEKYGPLTIVLARFIPGVRTVAPIAAGVGTMNYSTFFMYNAVGAVLWLVIIMSAGYFLGSVVPNIDKYILPIIFVVIVLSVLPGIIGYLKHRKS